MKRSLLVKFRGTRTQAEMGKIFRVSQQTWATWENGTSAPKIPTMKKIEKASGYPMERIFFDLFNPKKG